jgi:hypothetical protein
VRAGADRLELRREKLLAVVAWRAECPGLDRLVVVADHQRNFVGRNPMQPVLEVAG